VNAGGSRPRAKRALSLSRLPVTRDSFARVPDGSSLRGTLMGDPISNGITVVALSLSLSRVSQES